MLLILMFLGIVGGIIIGVFSPIDIPQIYSPYVAVAILAALDSVFGAIRGIVLKDFDSITLISGLIGNAILAVLLTYIGDKLGVQLYLAAIFVFGSRLFQNFAFIQRFLLNKYLKKDII